MVFMQEILTLCKNRRILFDNKTTDQHKKSEQVQKLLSLVDMVIVQNGGQPYTNEYFVELKVSAFKILGYQFVCKIITIITQLMH